MAAELSEQQIREFRESLRERFNELREQVRQELTEARHTRYADLAGDVHDPEEESLADLLVDLELAEINRHVREIRAVEAALLRIVRGGFGNCVDCGEAISTARLEAYPAAERCLACQAEYERNHPDAAGGHHQL